MTTQSATGRCSPPRSAVSATDWPCSSATTRSSSLVCHVTSEGQEATVGLASRRAEPSGREQGLEQMYIITRYTTLCYPSLHYFTLQHCFSLSYNRLSFLYSTLSYMAIINNVQCSRYNATHPAKQTKHYNTFFLCSAYLHILLMSILALCILFYIYFTIDGQPETK